MWIVQDGMASVLGKRGKRGTCMTDGGSGVRVPGLGCESDELI